MNTVAPAAALCAALGLALGAAPRRLLVEALATLALAAFAATRAPWPAHAVLVAWGSVLATAACVYLPGGPRPWLLRLLALNAGIWSGAVVGVDIALLAQALPWALLCLPATWLVVRQRQIALKVVASWLVAVAVLAAGLPTFSTPASVPDHME